jgi:hypothetical protein
MKLPVGLPTEDSADGELARLLALALGTAFGASDGTAVAADLLALAGALADARQALRDLADEAFVDTANDLLDELERAYGLPVQPDLSLVSRRARLTAKVRAARAGTPDDILRAVRALDPTATLTENTPASVPRTADLPGPPAVAGGDRFVFLFAVRLAVATWSDTSLRARIDALLDQMQPAHTDHVLHTNDPANGFRFDDPDSLFDRDVFGT